MDKFVAVLASVGTSVFGYDADDVQKELDQF